MFQSLSAAPPDAPLRPPFPRDRRPRLSFSSNDSVSQCVNSDFSTLTPMQWILWHKKMNSVQEGNIQNQQSNLTNNADIPPNQPDLAQNFLGPIRLGTNLDTSKNKILPLSARLMNGVPIRTIPYHRSVAKMFKKRVLSNEKMDVNYDEPTPQVMDASNVSHSSIGEMEVDDNLSSMEIDDDAFYGEPMETATGVPSPFKPRFKVVRF